MREIILKNDCLFDYLTLYRRLNHGKQLVFFDYLGVFKTTKGPGAKLNPLCPELFFQTASGTKNTVKS